jgi:uncharacterized membrane protein YccF (DUF307 family)
MTTTYGFDLARSRSRGARIARIDALATLLDTALVIPGTGVRFGLDALIGLFPVVGDIITTGLLWIVFGGLWMALGWAIAAVIMAITIVGLPWARAAFSIAAYTLLPFGYKAVSRDEYLGREDVGTGLLGVIGNIVWLVFAGWWLALGHLVTAILLAVTIVGIPFAWAHLKLAGLALWPIGKAIVPAQNAPLQWPPHR